MRLPKQPTSMFKVDVMFVLVKQNAKPFVLFLCGRSHLSHTRSHANPIQISVVFTTQYAQTEIFVDHGEDHAGGGSSSLTAHRCGIKEACAILISSKASAL